MLPEKNIIHNKKELNDWLNYELGKYNSSFFKDLFLIGENAILRKHLRLLRKTEYFANTHKKIRFFISKIRLVNFQCKYSLHIPLNCCQRGFKIMHVGPVLINPNARVGNDCSFHINTALVAGGKNGSAPILGNGVVVGIGAVVLGEVSVADNVAIGANAVVNKDVLESNIAVAGVPAKKISNNGRLSWNKNSKE